MSRYTGRCGRGARRRVREQKRREAEARNAHTSPLRRRIARTGCPTGKKKFETEADAWRGLGDAIVARTRGSNRHERRVYDCGLCTGWHLTSQKFMTPAERVLHWFRSRRRRPNRKAAAA